jgi:hypothetical protein
LIITEIGLSALSKGDTLADWNNKRIDNIVRKSFGRVLTSAAWTGSAGTAADGILELYDDLESIIKLPNIRADNILTREDVVDLEAYIASKHSFDIECWNAMSNTAALHLSFLEQRPGESLVGKIQGAEVTLFESLGTPTDGVGNYMTATKILKHHMVNEDVDRFIPFSFLVGGSAVLDSGIEFTVDGDFRGSLYNFATALTMKHSSWFPTNIYIPKGSEFDIAGIDTAPAEVKVGLKIFELTDSPMAAEVEASKPEGV